MMGSKQGVKIKDENAHRDEDSGAVVFDDKIAYQKRLSQKQGINNFVNQANKVGKLEYSVNQLSKKLDMILDKLGES